jgi:acyl CoA:acetate/3-ketoacid CoA transferase alpha subunit
MIESIKLRWKRDEVTLGGWCNIPTSLTAEILAKGGFDWVLVDMQHGCMDYQTAVEMIRAIDLARCRGDGNRRADDPERARSAESGRVLSLSTTWAAQPRPHPGYGARRDGLCLYRQ